MTPRTVSVEALRTIPILHGLSDDERRQIGEASTVMPFSAGEVVLRQGKTSQNLWIVLEGTCEVLRQLTDPQGRTVDVVLAELPMQSAFGEMSFFHSAPHSASVRAKTDLILLRLERSKYDALLATAQTSAYKLAVNIVETLATRLRRMDDWVVELMNPATGQKQPPEWAQFRKKLFGSWDNI